MKPTIQALTLLALNLFPLSSLIAAPAEKPSIIPEPQSLHLDASNQTAAAKILSEKLAPSLGKEAYTLILSPQGITIEYGDDAGLFYAKQTLKQLQAQYGAKLPCLTIQDHPRFGWRGMMIDPARHFWKPEDIKTFIDAMATYKFNKLHIHLTDDQGWRLPVPGYPKLESIASKRAGTDGDQIPHGGIYTKAQLKDIVSYAAQHHIEVIPEVDMPGHNQALASAYPEMICFPNPKLKVREVPGVSKELVCPANPEVWKFYDAVLHELKDIFPSSYVHLGGDEAPTDNWDECPNCEKLREKHHLKNGHQQLGFFFEEMSKKLKALGKKPLLWFEESEIPYPAGSTVYTWRLGKTPSAITQTREKKLNLICSPGEHCYFDYPQVAGDVGMGPLITLEQCYQLDPGYGLPADKQAHIIGVEAPIWGEKIKNLKRAFYMAYPRALALSEAGWSPMNVRSWANFSRKLKFQDDFMFQNWQVHLNRPSDDK